METYHQYMVTFTIMMENNIPQIYFNEKMMEYYGVSLSTQVSDKPIWAPECFEEIPQTVAVEADLVDEPGGLPNSHGDPQVTIG